ncbi:MAG TPA: hypothetical protein ENL20_12745 [Candidatus Cloacimonetes bacterium]|nr:hypothetical protein [Candidatus Cloacimonadota bacterium]
MNCPNQEKNQQSCNCSYPCGKKGICCECISYHRSRRELPACYFSNDAERTYDRSISYFIELNS